MNKRTCSIEGCGNSHASYGYCDKHYRRWRKTGDALILLRSNRKVCSEQGCEKSASGRGLCPAHYANWHYRNKSKTFELESCRAGGCTSPRDYADYCRRHNRLLKKYGDPHYVKPTATHKMCNRCKSNLPVDSFTKRKGRAEHTRQSRCKACIIQVQRERRARIGEEYNAYQRRWASENRDKRSSYETVQKARRRGNHVEKIQRIEIFERDGWVCQMCFQPVDPSLKFPHPMSATWDHIIPLSKGGPHTRENLRLAHWRENFIKGNKMPA